MADSTQPGSSNNPQGQSSGTGTNPSGDSSRNPNSRSKTLEEIRGGKKSTGKKARNIAFGTAAVAAGALRPRRKGNFWLSILYAVLIAFIIRSFFIEAFRIPTGSMKNTLLVGDFLFVNKVSYFLKSPKYFPFTTVEIPFFSIKTGSIDRGDVIVFEYPGDQDQVVPVEKKVNYIKRCIGLPGDTIQVINKQVFVNGKRMTNPADMVYREHAQPQNVPDPNIFPKGAPWNKDWYGPIRIPKKGDVVQLNRDNFSRWAVFIEREGHHAVLSPTGDIEIDGKFASTYTVLRDYLWMMGDNRDDSEDSRFWGYAPVDNVVGDALIIYWSHYSPPSNGYGDGYDPDEVQTGHFRWERIGQLIH